VDLAAEAERLRLDVLTVDVCRRLDVAGVPNVVLKGPSSALWLYEPPRRYVDVDVLVPLSRVDDAAGALTNAGIATRSAGAVGEEASHSLLMVSPSGYEVDLHVSLPMVPTVGDRAWEVLRTHIEPMDIGVGTVPVLDEAGRCLVLTLHAVSSGEMSSRTTEDLRRALAAASADSWRAARELADAIEVGDFFEAGLVLAGQGDVSALSDRAYLSIVGAPSAAFALRRLAGLPLAARPRALLREIFPSRGFMQRMYPDAQTPTRLARAHLDRWQTITRQLPHAWRTEREVRRKRRDNNG
jgi:hypothetical protein